MVVMRNNRLTIPAVVRVIFVAAAIWALLVVIYGHDAPWWTWWVKGAITLPGVVMCAAAATRQREGEAVLAAAWLTAWATVQAIRLQWSDQYQWRALLVASSTYVLVAMLAIGLAIYVATLGEMHAASMRLDEGQRDAG